MEPDLGELFCVPPAQFVATRDRLAAAARADGDKELARRIRGLRRPTLTAWAVNLLAHRDPERLARLLDIGAALRSAWERGGDLGDPERRRGELIPRLVRRAAELAADAGTPIRDAALREIEETLYAATIDPQAAEQVRTGRLSRPLAHTGFAPPGALPAPGGEPATRPAAEPAAKKTPSRPRGRTAGAEPQATAPPREDPRLRLRRLTVEADDAAERFAAAEREEADWRGERDRAHGDLAAVDAELARLRALLRDRQADREAAERRLRIARREHERAAKAVATARRRAAEAKRRLDAAIAETGERRRGTRGDRR